MGFTRWLFPMLLGAVACLGACHSCGNTRPPVEREVAPKTPTLRLYLLSTLAGALEPCGCSKDQLGGVDHLAAFIDSERAAMPNAVTLAAGPLLYLDSQLKPALASQDRSKAEALAQAMKHVGLAGWAPGYNDWAGGEPLLRKYAALAGATMLGIGVDGLDKSKLMTIGGVKLGLIGVSEPRDRMGGHPAGVQVQFAGDAAAQVGAEMAKLQKMGARLTVVLAAMPRGAALRIADANPAIDVLVVGKPSADGHGNTPQSPPEMIGSTLVVETANHGQAVSVVDIFLRGSSAKERLSDAGGIKKATEIGALSLRIRAIQARLNSWDKGGTVAAEDIAARKKELAQLLKARDALKAEGPAPKGSFFRYRVQEVREELGQHEAVLGQMKAFYKRVNEHNKTALADLKPPPLAPGQAGYVGVEACSDCHDEAREFWETTPHAKAYQTLVKEFKEYNLECVGCHVTGYGKAGGSTVTHNELLRGVQCEDCHGPGSNHVENPEKAGQIVRMPALRLCTERCHHPPHVEGFKAASKLNLILGKGHGEGHGK